MSSLRTRLASLPVATALRETLREGYDTGKFTRDVMAGLVVGVVALPLAMALAIGTGVAPQHGLYTALIAGILIALLGGSRGNVSGPTAAFIVILQPVVAQHGLGGLLVATVMAGMLLVAMGVARLGRFIEYIPYPVTTGFTAGIAVVIALLQVRDFFGLELEGEPAHFFERVMLLARALPSFHGPDLAIGAATLAVLIVWPRLRSRVPGHLVAVLVGALLAWLGTLLLPGFSVATIGSEFSYVVDGVVHAGIPAQLPTLQWPWQWPGAGGEPFELSFASVRELAAPAFAIAMLGAIESLLCAVVVDGFLRTRHNPNAELIGQGIGNMVVPFFGGITATGALARSATSIRAGARSPVAAVVHGLVILLALVSLAPLLAHLPMASLAALLLITAWNMSESRQFLQVLRIGPRSDKAVLLTCFILTVVFDMVIAVGVGMVLAALLFMHRVAALGGGRWQAAAPGAGAGMDNGLPADTRLYQMDGPLFFGASNRIMAALRITDPDVRTVILWLGDVPMMDVTGLIALRTALRELKAQRIFVILAGARREPRRLMQQAGIGLDPARAVYVDSIVEALVVASARHRDDLRAPGLPLAS